MSRDYTSVAASLLASRANSSTRYPDARLIPQLVDTCLSTLFPQHAHNEALDERGMAQKVSSVSAVLTAVLEPVLKNEHELVSLVDDFINQLPRFQALLIEDSEAILKGDPAATCADEVIIAYPGFLAIAVYRLAHFLFQRNAPLVPRMLSEYAHRLTGIDIHPGATIGRSFVIDHGTGIVIGETTVIHDNVKIYQGVTLGALSVSKSMANRKRHPTIEHDVIIYANATILGGDTIIGAESIVGGNVWITESIPPNSRVYHNP